MEKTPRSEAFEYKIVGTHRLGTFKKELSQAADEGFEIILPAFVPVGFAVLLVARSPNR